MEQILKSLTKFCILIGVDAPEDRLRLNANMLAVKYTAAEVSQALNRMAYTQKWFPDIPAIVEAIEGDKETKRDMAEIGAAEILEVARSYSSIDAAFARKRLGEFLWTAVEGFGGFEELTMLKHEQINTSRAQLRNLLAAKIRHPEDSKDLFFKALNEKAERISQENDKLNGQMLSIADAVKMIGASDDKAE